MNESNSIETLANTYSNLCAIQFINQTKFRLNGINKIKDCFNSEIHKRRLNLLLLFIILRKL